MALIEVSGLTKFYRMGQTDVHALDGVDLTIEKGEFVAITGASGSGKSTMMHLLGCLDRPTAGTYLLNGRNVGEMSDRELAAIRNRYIGFVFQTFNLINRTPAVDNVAVPLFYARRANTRTAARAALERVGLGHRWNHAPNELSGGERQRVAIARAIVNNPVLVLADEPTGNLDTRTGEQIMDIFRTLNEQGVTIVLVTHEPDVAMQARRIVQMRDGHIVADLSVEAYTASVSAATVPAARAAAAPVQARAVSAVGAGGGAGVAALRPGMGGGPEPEPVPEAVTPAARDYSNLPPKLVPGANATLILGLVGVAFLGAAIGLFGVAVQRAMALRKAGFEFTPKATVPPELVAPALGGLACFLVSVIVGIVAAIWGIRVRRRMRREPGNWVGRKRAVVGMLLGWLVIVIPALWIVLPILAGIVRNLSGPAPG